MAWVKVKGMAGLMFVPDHSDGAKKHPCADCFSCQWCSDERCAQCRIRKKSCGKAACKCRKKSRRAVAR